MKESKESVVGDLVTFEWVRHTEGYRLKSTGNADANPYESGKTSDMFASMQDYEIVPNHENEETKICRPLADATCTNAGTIARVFSQVGNSDGEVLGFVNTYGLLWKDKKTTINEFHRLKKEVAGILAEIDRCKHKASRIETKAGLNHEDAKAKCFDGLQSRFNSDMKEHLIYRPLITNGAKSYLREIKFTPNSLFSAIGLLIAYEIAGEIETKQCDNCGRYFTRGPRGEKKGNADVCSLDCRTNLDNKRKLAIKKKLNDEKKVEKDRTKATLTQKPCVICGAEFTPIRESTKTCNLDRCRKAYYRKQKKETSK